MRMQTMAAQFGGKETMFGFSNKKENLEKKYRKLMAESYELSHTNRTKSDQKLSEANEVLKLIEKLEATDS